MDFLWHAFYIFLGCLACISCFLIGTMFPVIVEHQIKKRL